jgi:hypothetical protein
VSAVGGAAAAGLLGALVAVGELVSRYRDDPARAILSLSATLYVGVNAAGAVAAFALISTFGWRFGASSESLPVTQVLVAGFGSAALFRTSLFNVTAGDQVIGIGPSAVLNVLLSAADRAVDRKRARIRSETTTASMDGFSFEMGADALVAYCFAAMQNASADEVKDIEDKIVALRAKPNDHMPDQVKSYGLGLSLVTVVGDKVLHEAVQRLKGSLSRMSSESAVNEQGEQRERGGPKTAAREQQVLDILRENGPLEEKELQKQAQLTIIQYGDLIGDLQRRRLVELDKSSGQDLVQLAGASGEG